MIPVIYVTLSGVILPDLNKANKKTLKDGWTFASEKLVKIWSDNGVGEYREWVRA